MEEATLGITYDELKTGSAYSYKRRRQHGVGIYTGDVERHSSGDLKVKLRLLTDEEIWVNPAALRAAFAVHTAEFWQEWQDHKLCKEEIAKLVLSCRGLLANTQTFNHYRGEKSLVQFGCLLEIWCCMQLEKLSLKWSYEEKSFSFQDGSVFRPDFFLPEYNINFEITGSPRSGKSKKLKRMRAEFPKETITCISQGKMLEMAEATKEGKGYFVRWLLAHKEPWRESRQSSFHTKH